MHDTDDSVNRFLAEIVESVRKVYLDELIVLKTKPTIRNQSEEWLTSYLESINDTNLIINSVPTPFLVQRSKLMLTVGGTTAAFDFILREVPSIEHTRYAKDFEKYYPEQLSWTAYKVTRTSTTAELDQAINNVRTERFQPISRTELEKMILNRGDESFVTEI